jgi:uncharacterized membrane protein
MDLGAIIKKMKKCVFLVSEAEFGKIASDKEFMGSFVYLLILAVISVVGSAVMQVVSAMFQPAAALNFGAIIISAPLAYAICIIAAYAWMAIMHVLLKLVGGKADFLKTAQVFIYGSTPSFLFGWIPLVGLIAMLATLVNVVIGSKKVHGISLLRAIIAVVVVPVVVVAIIILVGAAYLTSQMTGFTQAFPAP